MLQQLFCHRPAVVERADQLARRHPYVVKKHLAKARLAADQLNRLDRDARAFHVDQDEADALLLLDGGVGAHQGVHPVSRVAVGGPDFRAVDDEVAVLILARRGLQAGQVGAGIGLAETLAPAHAAFHHGRQVLAFLRFGAQFEQHRPKHPHAQVELGRAAGQAQHFLLDDARLLRAQTAATQLGWPVRRKPALVAHALEPDALVVIAKSDLRAAPDDLLLRQGLAHSGRAVGLQPGTGISAKNFSVLHGLPLRVRGFR